MNNIVIRIQLEHNIKMVFCFRGKITGTVFPVVICYQQRYHRRQLGLLCHDTCPILQGILTCCHEAYIIGYYYDDAYLASGNQAKFQSFMKIGNFFLHHIHAYPDFHPAEKSVLSGETVDIIRTPWRGRDQGEASVFRLLLSLASSWWPCRFQHVACFLDPMMT